MKKDPRVDAYVAKAEPFARPVLSRLRAAVHGACPRAEETVKWGMPFFLSDGKILCFMAAFKAHVGFGFWRGAKTAALGRSPAKAGEAIGQLGRIASLEDLPPDAMLHGWIRKAARSIASAGRSRGETKKATSRRESGKTTRRKP